MKAIIFDLDGTLIDSAPDIHASVNKMLAAEGQDALDLSTVTAFIGNGLPKLVERVIKRVGMDMAEFDRIVADVLAIYNASAADLTRPLSAYGGGAGGLERGRVSAWRLHQQAA